MGILDYQEQYFEDIEEGHSRRLDDVRTITEADVVNFAGISGDVNPIHLSKEYNDGPGNFERRVAHGTLVFSIATSYAHGINPRSFSYGYDNLRFVGPVYVGDTITIRSEVIEAEVYDEEYGRIVERYDVENQDGETVLTAEHISLVERRDGASE